MAKLSENELKARNNKIVARYRDIAQRQPLAKDYAIYTFIAPEFNLTINAIGEIVRKYFKANPDKIINR